MVGSAQLAFATGTDADTAVELDCFANLGGEVDGLICPMSALSSEKGEGREVHHTVRAIRAAAGSKPAVSAVTVTLSVSAWQMNADTPSVIHSLMSPQNARMRRFRAATSCTAPRSALLRKNVAIATKGSP